MDITTETTKGIVVIRVAGRMDATTAPEFEQSHTGWEGGGAGTYVVDLGGLEYISSAGLRSFLAVAKKVKGAGGSLSFCHVEGMVAEVFKISGFQSLFTLHDSLDDAMGA